MFFGNFALKLKKQPHNVKNYMGSLAFRHRVVFARYGLPTALQMHPAFTVT